MEVFLDGKPIGRGKPCFIIAEAGVNHNGSLETALTLVDKAKEVGADCVKFQTFKAAAVVTREAPKANYQLEVTDRSESQLEMLQRLELSLEDYRKIIARCKEREILFLSTPYSAEDADFLNDLGVAGFKIASGQIVEWDFLRHVARLGKPMIMSTGMATMSEVFDGVQAVRAEGNEQIIVLQCTTNYPSRVEDSNIRCMLSIDKCVQCLTGYSDHVPNNFPCYAAVSLGACVIEKHFTLDNEMPGPDHSSSLNPTDFAELVRGIRAVEASLGSFIKEPCKAEQLNMTGMRRSIVLVKDVAAGEVIARSHLAFKRPATGLPPGELDKIIGQRYALDLRVDSILHMHDIQWTKL